MKRLTALGLSAAFAVAAVFSSFAVAPTDFKMKVPITVNAAAVGEKSATDLPVLVRISEAGISGFSYGDLAADGSDLAFGVDNGLSITVYPHEIDTWNPEGESLVWVKVPVLSASTAFNMYYGNGVSGGAAASSTWSNYTGVWHFGEAKTLTDEQSAAWPTAQAVYANSTAAEGLEGYLSSDSSSGEEGRFGKCFRTNEAGCKTGSFNNGGAWVNDAGTDSPLDRGDTFTISGWFKHPEEKYYYDHIFYKRSQGDNKTDKANTKKFTGGFAIELSASSLATPKFDVRGGNGTSKAGGALNAYNAWSYLTFVFEGSKITVYENGAQEYTATGLGNVTNNDAPLGIGTRPDIAYSGCTGDANWCGWIDEVRLNPAAASADYVALEYAAMADNLFLAYGLPVTQDAEAPVFAGTPTLTLNGEGNPVFSVTVDSGKGSISAEYTVLASAAATLSELATDVEVVEGTPQTFTDLPTLAADTMYSWAAVGESPTGTQVRRAGDGVFYNGTLAVTAGENASEGPGTSGSFVITRADTAAAKAGDLVVNYTVVGGEGTYESLSGVATIPDGAASVTVPIVPVFNPDITEDVTLTLTLTAGPYLTSESSASIEVVNSESSPCHRYVSTTGDDEYDGMTPATPMRTVQAAMADLAAKVSGEEMTIWVATGEYVFSEKLTINLPLTIRSRSGNPADVVFSEDQSAGCNIFTLDHADAKLMDITVSNGGGGNYSTAVNGGNVYITANGGTVEHCVIIGGTNNAKHGCYGGNVYMLAGRVTRCEIKNGKSHSAGGGGNVYLKAGIVENCLISGGGACGTNGSGVRIDGGVLANCTIVGNDGTSSSGVFCGNDAARVVNCVIVDNVYTSSDWAYANACGPESMASCFLNCMTDGIEQPNATCFGVPFGFVNQPQGDYHLTAVSAARNAGATVANLGELDFDGKARKSGAAVDVGCYEFDESVASVGFDAVGTENLAPYDVTFTAVSAGVDSPVYVWDFGDGTDPVESSDSSVRHTYESAGHFTVSVSIKGTEVSASIADFVKSHPTVMYVDQTCMTSEYPYDTPETAATSILAALAEAYDGTTIYLQDGTYTVAEQIKVLIGVTIRSLSGDQDAVVVQGNGSRGVRVFYLNHPDAWLRDMTLTKGYTYQSNGGNVYIDSMGGNVSNCVLSAGLANNNASKGGNLYMQSDAAFVTHCRIKGGKTDDNGNNDGSANVYMTKGRLENSLICDGIDNSNGSRTKCVAGVYLAGGSMRNCTIAGNGGKQIGGVYAENTATVVDCVIAGNTVSVASGDAAAFAGDAACFVNCLADTATAINGTCLFDATAKILKNADALDYTHAAGSQAIDASGEWEDAPAVDLDGNDRNQGEGIDLGCYETEAGAFAVGFDSDIKTAILDANGEATVVFTATPSGNGPDDVISYAWDFNGDGEPDTVTTSPVITNVYAVGGIYTVTLAATDTTTGKAAEVVTKPDMLQFAPKTLYVDLENETQMVPFGSWESASTTITNAIAAALDGCEIVIRAGTYKNGTIFIDKELDIHSETGNREDVRLSGNGSYRVVTIANAGALVHGLVVEDGTSNSSSAGATFDVRGGTISNCVIRNCYSFNYSGAGAAVWSESADALVTHCIITNNTLASDNGGGTKGIIHLGRGRISNCLIQGNHEAADGGPATCLIDMWGSAVLENCTVVGNSTRNRQCIYMTAPAAVTNCVFADNVFSTAEGRGFQTGASDTTFVNCATDLSEPLNDTCVVGTTAEFFKDYAAGDLTPMTGGKLQNKGVKYDGMPSVDLAGKPRVVGKTIDIGCYEGVPNGLTVIVR